MPATAVMVGRETARAAATIVRGRSATLLATTACAGACTLMVLAPFEMARPLVRLPGQSVTSVEVVLLVVLGACGLAALASRQWPLWRSPLTWPWLVFLAAMSVAAAASDAGARVNAFHMVGRFGIALLVYLVAVNGGTSLGRVRIMLTAGIASGLFVAMLAILEYFGVGPIRALLHVFRPAVTVVGDHVRASGPLQYPTIASMWLEIAFAIGLGLLIDASGRLRLALFLVLAIIAEAIVMTFTRSGLLTMAVSLAIVGGFWYRRRGFDGAVKAIACLAIVVAVQFVSSRSVEAMRLRLTTEGQDAWYRFSIDAPRHVTIRTGARTSVPIRLTNTGQVTWDSEADEPFLASYHWLLPDVDSVVSYEGLRTPFPAVVPAAESVELQLLVEAPRQPGRYRLMWDVTQEHRLWFSTEPGATPIVSEATVTGPAIGSAPLRLSPLPRPRERPGRLVLWRAAMGMFAAHPLTGVGPDNFRLEYGPYAGLRNPDQRVHSNNMYLEILVGGGILGICAFAWLFARAARTVGCLTRLDAGMGFPMGLGVAAAVAAIAVHGLVDSFLSFTPTYVLISLTLGLAVACSRGTNSDADRV